MFLKDYWEHEPMTKADKSWKDQEVWTATLDNRYNIRVNRTAPYKGLLTVTDLVAAKPEILYQEQVSLAYDARFGPDTDDVATWQDMVAKFIDERSTMPSNSSSP